MGAEKFGSFVAECGGDEAEARRLALFNVRLAGAYLPALAVLELALRNSIAVQLATVFGENWPHQLAEGKTVRAGRRRLNLTEQHCRRFEEARDHLTRKGCSTASPDIIGATSMGVWVGLTGGGAPHEGKYYETQLWTPLISHAFPGMNAVYGVRSRKGRYSQRELLHHDLNRVLDLRNRVAHHERITHLDHETETERIARAVTAMVGVLPGSLDDLIPNPEELETRRRAEVVRGA